jgi:hypothetical protein
MSYYVFVCVCSSDVQHFVLSYIFTFRVPFCDVRIKTMFGSSLPPVVSWRAHVLCT